MKKFALAALAIAFTVAVGCGPAPTSAPKAPEKTPEKTPEKPKA